MTDITICGACGKMGRVIYDIISARNDCRVVSGVDKVGESYGDFPVYNKISKLESKPDVIIDFSHPSLLDDLLEYCLTNGVAAVIATTGYSQEQISKIHKAAESIPIFFTFNMSLGINLLADLAKRAVKVLGDQFDIEIVEKHHNQKIDAPSGTALMIADAINQVRENSMQYVYDRHSQRKKREKREIGLHSVRGGTIVGEHQVIFAGQSEVLTLSHSAQSKELFAAGAVNAAVFMPGKAPGLYDMSHLI